MSKEKEDAEKAYDIGQHRAEVFYSRNGLDKFVSGGIPVDSNMSEAEKEAFDKGIVSFPIFCAIQN